MYLSLKRPHWRNVSADICYRYKFSDIRVFWIIAKYFEQFLERWSICWLVRPTFLHNSVYVIGTSVSLLQSFAIFNEFNHLKITITMMNFLILRQNLFNLLQLLFCFRRAADQRRTFPIKLLHNSKHRWHVKKFRN